MRNDKKEKKVAVIILLLLLLIAVGFGSYIYFFKDLEDNDGEITTLEEKVTESMPEITPGEVLDWTGEQLSFTLPEGWSYEIITNNLMEENIVITGNELTYDMAYLPVDAEFNWSAQDNVSYQNNVGSIYEEDGQTKVVLNRSKTITSQDLINDTTTKEEYNLFIIISKDGEPVTTLTDLEAHYLKYILDGYASNSVTE